MKRVVLRWCDVGCESLSGNCVNEIVCHGLRYFFLFKIYESLKRVLTLIYSLLPYAGLLQIIYWEK